MRHRTEPLRRHWLACLLIALACAAGEAVAFEIPELFVDPEDGKLDLSQYLASRHGFLPVPIIVTEPAVGVGGGLATAYFHQLKELDADRHPHQGPPSISLAAAAITTNGTWFGAIGHSGSWKNDHLRYLGMGAFAHPVLDFFGTDLESSGDGLTWTADAWVLFQRLRMRVSESNWWIGADYVYSNSEIAFDQSNHLPPVLSELKFRVETGGIGVLVEFDNRNSTFTPTNGTRVELQSRFMRDWLGSDESFDTWRLNANQLFALGRYSSVGLRFVGELIDGDAPFYAYPFVHLRGIPAMRYQGESVWTGEVEVLWGFTPRWTLVGFGGAGYTTAAVGDRTDTAVAGGTGFRYRMARLFQLQGGLDVAWGPEDFAWYITVGDAW